MEKMNALLLEYHLSMDEVAVRGLKFKTVAIETGAARHDGAFWMACSGLADFFNGESWIGRRWSGDRRRYEVAWQFFIATEDEEPLMYLYRVIRTAMNTELARYQQTTMYLLSSEPGKILSNDFRKAFCARVRERLQAMRKDHAAKVEAQVSPTGTSLVVLRNSLMKQEYAKLGLRLKKSSTTTSHGSSGDAAGRAAANRVNLSGSNVRLLG
jgi:hypothetical protein